MKSHKQYLIVGVFVLVGLSLIIATLLWFSASSRKAFDTYRITFNEPIDGVTSNSIVKYNGVEVGKVKSIQLDNKNPRNIYVYINVNRGLAITTATYATIKPQGVTGMSYVALNLTAEVKFTLVAPHNSEPYPEIPAKTSFLYSMTEQARSVTSNVQEISAQVKALLNEKNLDHVASIISNLDKVTIALAKQSDSIGRSIGLVGEVLNNVNQNTQHLNDAIVQIGELSKSLQKNSANFDKVLTTVQNNTLRNLNSVLLPNLNQAVTNLTYTSGQFNELMQTVNQSPSALIRGVSAKPAGPGE